MGHEIVFDVPKQKKPTLPTMREALAYVLERCLPLLKSRYTPPVLLVGLLFYLYFGSNVLAIVFSLIALLCFIPMFMFRMLGMEFGFAAMIMLSSLQSFEVGFIVGKLPNLLGHILTMNIDLDLIYEFIIYIPFALIAALFPFHMIAQVGIILTIIYTAGYLLYFSLMGLLGPVEISYALTNCVFNIIVFMKVVPLLQLLGYG